MSHPLDVAIDVLTSRRTALTRKVAEIDSTISLLQQLKQRDLPGGAGDGIAEGREESRDTKPLEGTAQVARTPDPPTPKAAGPESGLSPAFPKSQRERIREMWVRPDKPTAKVIAKAIGCTQGAVYNAVHDASLPALPPRRSGRKAGTSIVARAADSEPVAKRRFTEVHDLHPEEVRGLPAGHRALSEKRSIFQTTVVDVADSPALLVSGQNSVKIGSHVTKGPWKGMPIFVLTLEERASCPETCHHWASCYGNGMPRARRHRHGPELERRLETELAALQESHPKGFVVRLHALGDFYSLDYVALWALWLDRFTALHVFGYTAWQADTEIGAAIVRLRDTRWDRFAIRTSAEDSLPCGSTTLWVKPQGPRIKAGIVCPAQTGATDCCGTCGLCWAKAAKDETIVFVAHGPVRGRKPREERPAIEVLPRSDGHPIDATHPPDCRVTERPLRRVEVPERRVFRQATDVQPSRPRVVGRPLPPIPYVAPNGWDETKRGDFCCCWRDGMRVADMAIRFGINGDEVKRKAKQFQLPDRGVFTGAGE